MKSSLTAAASMAVLMTLGAGVSQAQTASTSVDEIVVTGSRIRTSPLDRDQPVVQIDQETAAKQGLTSTVTTPSIYALGTVTTIVSFAVMGIAVGLAMWLGKRQKRAGP